MIGSGVIARWERSRKLDVVFQQIQEGQQIGSRSFNKNLLAFLNLLEHDARPTAGAVTRVTAAMVIRRIGLCNRLCAVAKLSALVNEIADHETRFV